MATKICRVPDKIAKEGLNKAGGRWQEEKYGKNMRVCNTAGNATTPKLVDTVTGEEFSDTKLKS